MLDVSSDAGIHIANKENYVASTDDDTTGHGTKVTNILAQFAPDSIYKLHRIVAENSEFKPGNILKAMDNLKDSNVDIINISAGKYHFDCNAQCRICESVKSVVESGKVVVAGAGNKKSDQPRGIYCPATSTKTISVGMCESLCRASPQQSSPRYIGPDNRTYNPPGAYQVNGHDDIDFYPNESYCSYNGCSAFHECDENREMKYWDGNVKWKEEYPEVVAPGHKALWNSDNQQLELEPGTSYSAAAVSGGIATVLSEKFPEVCSPPRIRRKLQATAQQLDCGVVGLFDMSQLYDSL